MELLQRTPQPLSRQHLRPPGGDPPSADLTSLRETAQALARAGSAAIARALSDNSEEFLKANRQEGGQ